MFVSHRYRAIFVHLQRTGGNSVHRVFEAHDPELVVAVPIDPAKQRTKHCFVADIADAIDPAVFAGYTKFCVVRNPFERLLSWYHFLADGGNVEDAGIRVAHGSRGLSVYERGLARLRAGRRGRLLGAYTGLAHGLGRALGIDPAEELELRCEAIGERVIREVRRNAASFTEFVELPRNHPGGLLERFFVNQLEYLQIDGELAVDHVLRFEQLGEDFAALATKLEFPGALPHVNASSRGRRYREAYDAQTRARVSERFAPDLAAFSYEF
ncbi:sulfotransferase family 2 domain-containing protein [Enhygromyxa salina]|uniref:Sulfotransferase family protein n=1 Tax=Enhygromyxa salina TaxID=215803 RepID=A0A2S9YTQ4_9BACT|nr:sulfotransferase family 2 domain-containing protein [Enhygromyxa salina]PRQ08460.1 Sulfotransferase family protein [Enhygromyxa salina]